MKRTPLHRLTPLRPRSKRRKAEAVVRRALVASLLEDRPFCEIQWDDGCDGVAVEVDELLGRGVGGSFLAENNCQTTCRYCHRMKHLNPAEAVRRGFTIQRRNGVSVPDPLSPDCEQRKCGACSGDAWDHLKDEPAPCTCSCHRRKP